MILVGTPILKMLSQKKCNTFLYLLSRIKVVLSFENRKRFYNAYILPHFELGCVIWGNCTSVMEDKLVKLQKRAARTILDVDVIVPSETMFTHLKWMTFPERVVYHKVIQMHKTVCGDAHDYLKYDFCLQLRFIQDYSDHLPFSALYTKTQH